MIDVLNCLKQKSISLSAEVSTFDGNKPAGRVSRTVNEAGIELLLGGARWQCDAAMEQKDGIIDAEVWFTLAEGSVACGNVSVALGFSDWSERNYVLMPAAAYNGNRFRVANKKYPPFLHEEDGIGADMPITITDVKQKNHSKKG
jgi:hypothetical protein